MVRVPLDEIFFVRPGVVRKATEWLYYGGFGESFCSVDMAFFSGVLLFTWLVGICVVWCRIAFIDLKKEVN
jgi:hypothetical protein